MSIAEQIEQAVRDFLDHRNFYMYGDPRPFDLAVPVGMAVGTLLDKPMNILEQIDNLPDDIDEIFGDISTAKLKELADTFRALVRSSKRVNAVMGENPTYRNVAFTMRTAIEKADRLLEYSLPETPDA